MQIKYDFDGFGMNGVVSVQLSFSLPAREYEDAGELYGAGSVTTLSCSNGAVFPVFYVISRSFSGDKLNMVCYDKTYTVDQDISVSEADFDEDGYILITALMSRICSVCRFSGYSDTTGMLSSTVTKAHKDHVTGSSCRSVLDDLSATCGGSWLCSGDTGDSGRPSGVLVLAAPDKYSGSAMSPDKYAAVNLGGTHRFTGIVLTNGDKTYTAGDTATLYNSYEADTPYASAQAAGDLYERLRNFVYRGWECSKMLCDFFPAPPALVTFGDRQLTANHCTLNLTSSGMYASLGGNAVSEDGVQYLNKTARELKDRYRLGDVMNNVKVSKDKGITYVYENKNSGEKKEYGFNVGEDGTVKFDGVMMDGKMPDKIEKVSGTSRAVYYDDKRYLMSWEMDGEGNRTDFKMEESDHKVSTDTKEEST